MEPTQASAGTTESKDSETWSQIKLELRSAHGEDIYTSWFERIEFESVSNTVVDLSTPTSFIRHWVQTHYATDIVQRWRAVRPDIGEVRFKVRSSLRPKTRPVRSGPAAGAPNTVDQTNGSAAPRRQIDGPPVPPNSAGGLEGSALDARHSFASLVEGPSNQLAVAVAKKVAFAQPGERAAYNPLFVTGAVGLGKTHLLQAIAGAANPARRTLYLTAEHFMYRFVSAVMNRTTISFKDILRDIDVLLIDDIQFLNGAKVQEEFGHTLTTLVDSQRQVVIAADRAPADLEGLDARVRSRLSGGLLVELTPPDYAMRKAILEQRISVQHEMFEDLVFPEEVVDFVARSITTNGRDLDGAVNRLVAHNQLTSAPIDLKMAENALRDLLRARESKKPKIEDIQRVTSQHFNVSRQDLVSARRTKVIVRPRQIAMYLSKTLTPRSLPEIGRRFGNRDHTTVLHAVRKVEDLITKDTQMAEDIETLKRLLDQ
ncbi:chromosomal replication initiator protein DnaA [Acuticoccus sp. I52.16.1]|uniref:chromosomal replication initiator protein DnaA n=1 Tax=Acuticoccus sp. I52.16.1 TaxID=2928472 RepID=UPI001FD4BCD5|nr:chromosomal replication initiator protein DnaA [Acuticoccus sp. I52.16.1]UOM33439.1 chromosomal replication initiator protein DnaA [Acuticoccus sp. I52.16.1]